jgi:hypothetical protein
VKATAKDCIDPKECLNCGAAEPVYPLEAITGDRVVAQGYPDFGAGNRWFFSEPLPGRGAPVAAAGGSGKTTAIGVDTLMVAER